MTTTYGPQSSSDETSSTRSTKMFSTSGTRTGYIPFAEVIIKSQDPNCTTTWNLPCEQIGYISDGDARVVTLSLRLGPAQPYDHPRGQWKEQVQTITKTAPEKDTISEDSEINHSWSLAPVGKKKLKKGMKKVLKDPNLKDRENQIKSLIDPIVPRKRGRPRLVRNIIARRGRPRKTSPRRMARVSQDVKEDVNDNNVNNIINNNPTDEVMKPVAIKKETTSVAGSEKSFDVKKVPTKKEEIVEKVEKVSIKKDTASIAGSEKSLDVKKKEKIKHNTPLCVYPGCNRYRVGTKNDNPIDGGPAGYRCLTHGVGGKTQCQVPKCHQFCVSFSEEKDIYGEKGRRCKDHGGWNQCNVPGCDLLTRGMAIDDDTYGMKGPRCRQHGGNGGQVKASVQNLQKPVGSRYNNTVMTKVELDEHEQEALGKTFLSVRLPYTVSGEEPPIVKPEEPVRIKDEMKTEETSTTISETLLPSLEIQPKKGMKTKKRRKSLPIKKKKSTDGGETSVMKLKKKKLKKRRKTIEGGETPIIKSKKKKLKKKLGKKLKKKKVDGETPSEIGLEKDKSLAEGTELVQKLKSKTGKKLKLKIGKKLKKSTGKIKKGRPLGKKIKKKLGRPLGRKNKKKVENVEIEKVNE